MFLLYTNKEGNKKVFVSQKECCEELGLKHSNIHGYISTTKKYGAGIMGILKGCKLEHIERKDFVVTYKGEVK